MPFTVNGQNAACDGIAAVAGFVSLHTGDPSTTGANEATGGSPAYARKAVTWAAASAGTRASSATITFDVPAGTYYHIGFHSAVTAGTYYGYYPLGGFTPQAGTAANTGDVITSYAHGLSNTQNVLVFDIQNAGVPAGLTEGTVYFVVGATADTFQVALTSGGAAVAITADAETGFVRVLPETFAAQGQYQIAAGSLILDARFA